jgi:hypothetical protein
LHSETLNVQSGALILHGGALILQGETFDLLSDAPAWQVETFV